MASTAKSKQQIPFLENRDLLIQTMKFVGEKDLLSMNAVCQLWRACFSESKTQETRRQIGTGLVKLDEIATEPAPQRGSFWHRSSNPAAEIVQKLVQMYIDIQHIQPIAGLISSLPEYEQSKIQLKVVESLAKKQLFLDAKEHTDEMDEYYKWDGYTVIGQQYVAHNRLDEAIAFTQLIRPDKEKCVERDRIYIKLIEKYIEAKDFESAFTLLDKMISNDSIMFSDICKQITAGLLELDREEEAELLLDRLKENKVYLSEYYHERNENMNASDREAVSEDRLHRSATYRLFLDHYALQKNSLGMSRIVLHYLKNYLFSSEDMYYSHTDPQEFESIEGLYTKSLASNDQIEQALAFLKGLRRGDDDHEGYYEPKEDNRQLLGFFELSKVIAEKGIPFEHIFGQLEGADQKTYVQGYIWYLWDQKKYDDAIGMIDTHLVLNQQIEVLQKLLILFGSDPELYIKIIDLIQTRCAHIIAQARDVEDRESIAIVEPDAGKAAASADEADPAWDAAAAGIEGGEEGHLEGEEENTVEDAEVDLDPLLEKQLKQLVFQATFHIQNFDPISPELEKKFFECIAFWVHHSPASILSIINYLDNTSFVEKTLDLYLETYSVESLLHFVCDKEFQRDLEENHISSTQLLAPILTHLIKTPENLPIIVQHFISLIPDPSAHYFDQTDQDDILYAVLFLSHYGCYTEVLAILDKIQKRQNLFVSILFQGSLQSSSRYISSDYEKTEWLRHRIGLFKDWRTKKPTSENDGVEDVDFSFGKVDKDFFWKADVQTTFRALQELSSKSLQLQIAVIYLQNMMTTRADEKIENNRSISSIDEHPLQWARCDIARQLTDIEAPVPFLTPEEVSTISAFLTEATTEITDVEIPDPQDLYCNLSQIHLMIGQPEPARALLDLALTQPVTEEKKPKRGEKQSSGNLKLKLAILYLHLHQEDKSVEMINDLFGINKEKKEKEAKNYNSFVTSMAGQRFYDQDDFMMMREEMSMMRDMSLMNEESFQKKLDILYTTFMMSSIKDKNPEEFQRVLEVVSNYKNSPGIRVYGTSTMESFHDFLVDYLIEHNLIEIASWYGLQLGSGDRKGSSFALKLLDYYLKNKQWDEFNTFLESHRSYHIFSHAIMELIEHGEIDQALDLAKILDPIPYSNIIKKLCSKGHIDQALALYQEEGESSDEKQSNYQSTTAIATAYCKQGEVDKAFALIDEFESNRPPLQPPTEEELKEEAKAAAEKPEEESAEDDIYDFSWRPTPTSLQERYESNKKERERQTKENYRKLIHALAKHGHLDAALEKIPQLQERSIEIQPGDLLHYLIQGKQLEDAIRILEEYPSENNKHYHGELALTCKRLGKTELLKKLAPFDSQKDPHSIKVVALIKERKFEEAIEMIKSNEKHHQVIKDYYDLMVAMHEISLPPQPQSRPRRSQVVVYY